jgi:hypothetical protein
MSTEEQRLAPLREKIDALDAQILDLLTQKRLKRWGMSRVVLRLRYFVLSVSVKSLLACKKSIKALCYQVVSLPFGVR